MNRNVEVRMIILLVLCVLLGTTVIALLGVLIALIGGYGDEFYLNIILFFGSLFAASMALIFVIVSLLISHMKNTSAISRRVAIANLILSGVLIAAGLFMLSLSV